MSNRVPTPTASRAGPIPALDGLRALAVSLVFLAHGGLQDVVPGGLGVTIFFVLSGYLITTLMRVEYAGLGRLHLRHFYLRRLLRLMPPLLLVLGLAGLFSGMSWIDGRFSRGGVLAALFYAGNYFVITQDFRGLPAGLGVIWSLAIEEHYYLVFPPLVSLFIASRRQADLPVLLALLCLAVLAWRCWLVLRGVSPEYIGMATDTRADAILVGSLMALVRNPWLDTGRAQGPGWRDAALAALALLAILGTLLYRSEPFRLTVRYTLQSLAIAVLIHLAVARSSQRPYRYLNLPVLTWLGSISYTVYLSHQLILLGLARHWPGAGTATVMTTAAVLSLGFAELVRRWIELPLRPWRTRLQDRVAQVEGAAVQPLPAS